MNHGRHRTGGVYIAVLGASLIASVLALSALVLQRVQNRLLVAAGDVQQAQLNAETAIQLGLLTMKQDDQWRDNFANGTWFTSRATGRGVCDLQVIDPLDADLANDADDPFVLVGIGRSGTAEQRASVAIEPRAEPLSCLRSAIAAGDLISLQSDTLRASGLISAASVSATSSNVYGDVEATSISGGTYRGTTTVITADQRPDMPDWATMFAYYKSVGTEISINSLPASTPNLCLNSSFESSTSGWTGTSPEPAVGNANISQSPDHVVSGGYGLKVRDRQQYYSGAHYLIDTFVKPNQQYYIQAWVYNHDASWRDFRITLYTRGTGNGSYLSSSGDIVWAQPNVWTPLAATLTATSWSGDLQYAFVKIAGGSAGSDKEFFSDDVDIREISTGRYIFRKVLSPSVNPFGGQVNPQGVYWIDCSGDRITIERSRILGTLLLINPGLNSSIGAGPIHWSPAVPGYPALLVSADNAVDGDFTISATDRVLSEYDAGTNFNPPGAAHEQLGQDADLSDIYPSEINGLVVIGDDLVYQNSPLIRGQLVVGDDIRDSSGSLDVDYEPDSLLSPPPGFTAPTTYVARPGSTTKVVLP